jgi:hypothetical protein
MNWFMPCRFLAITPDRSRWHPHNVALTKVRSIDRQSEDESSGRGTDAF